MLAPGAGAPRALTSRCAACEGRHACTRRATSVVPHAPRSRRLRDARDTTPHDDPWPPHPHPMVLLRNPAPVACHSPAHCCLSTARPRHHATPRYVRLAIGRSPSVPSALRTITGNCKCHYPRQGGCDGHSAAQRAAPTAHGCSCPSSGPDSARPAHLARSQVLSAGAAAVDGHSGHSPCPINGMPPLVLLPCHRARTRVTQHAAASPHGPSACARPHMKCCAGHAPSARARLPLSPKQAPVTPSRPPRRLHAAPRQLPREEGRGLAEEGKARDEVRGRAIAWARRRKACHRYGLGGGRAVTARRGDGAATVQRGVKRRRRGVERWRRGAAACATARAAAEGDGRACAGGRPKGSR